MAREDDGFATVTHGQEISVRYSKTYSSGGVMRIQETTELRHTTRIERQQQIIENITELERQHENGEIETPAYLMKKRSLIKML